MIPCPNSPFSAIMVTCMLAVLPTWTRAAHQQVPGTACGSAALADSKAEFKRLEGLRKRDPSAVDDSEFRAASIDYVGLAEACYQAWYGSIPNNRKFDNGGLWADWTDGNRGYRTAAVSPGAEDPRGHNLFGTKWGADSPCFLPVGNHFDATGPRSPGGVVTYSFMPNGVSLSAEDSGTNRAIGSLSSFEPCFY